MSEKWLSKYSKSTENRWLEKFKDGGGVKGNPDKNPFAEFEQPRTDLYQPKLSLYQQAMLQNIPVSDATKSTPNTQVIKQIDKEKERIEFKHETAKNIEKNNPRYSKEVTEKLAEDIARTNFDRDKFEHPVMTEYNQTDLQKERDKYVLEEGMNTREALRYPLQFLAGATPTEEETFQERLRFTDPTTSRVDKLKGTVGQALDLAPSAALNTGIGLAFAPSRLGKFGQVVDAVSPVGYIDPKNIVKGVKEQIFETGNTIKEGTGKSYPKSEIDWGKWNKEIPSNRALMKTTALEDTKTKLKDAFSDRDVDITGLENIRGRYRYENKAVTKELENLFFYDSYISLFEQRASGNLKNHLKTLVKEEGLDTNVYNKLIDDLDVTKLKYDTKEDLKLFFNKAKTHADEYFSNMDSPEMQKKLRNFSEEYGVDLVEEYKKYKNVFMKNEMFRIDYNSPRSELGSYGLDFDLAFGKNSEKPMYESYRINLNPSLIEREEGLRETIWHEISHSFNSKIRNNPKILKEIDDIFYKDVHSIPTEKIKKTWVEDFQNAKMGDSVNEQITYFTKPEEVWSHLSTNLKQELKKEGLIKDYSDPVTLEHLNKTQSEVITDYLPMIKNKTKLLELINKMTLAITPLIGTGAIGSQINSKEEIEEYKTGGWLKKYQ